jgi:hypothetical protein
MSRTEANLKSLDLRGNGKGKWRSKSQLCSKYGANYAKECNKEVTPNLVELRQPHSLCAMTRFARLALRQENNYQKHDSETEIFNPRGIESRHYSFKSLL